jgi:hypothetical protein
MRLGIDKVGEMTIVECDGTVVRSDAAFQAERCGHFATRCAHHRRGSHGGAGDRRWRPWHARLPLTVARHHGVQFKVFNPAKSVRDRLESLNPVLNGEIAGSAT